MKTELEHWYGLSTEAKLYIERPEAFVKFMGNSNRGINRVKNLQRHLSRESRQAAVRTARLQGLAL